MVTIYFTFALSIASTFCKFLQKLSKMWHGEKQSCFSNQPMPQFVAKINLCDSKLQEPFVTLYPLNKLSFCSALECVQLNRCTSSKINVLA